MATVIYYIQAALGGSLWTSISTSLLPTTSTVDIEEVKRSTVAALSTTPIPSDIDIGSTIPSAAKPIQLCLGIHDVFITLFLVLMILMTIFGNILVVLSVFVYKRMRTFTNILLTSLATADLLVGLAVMPLALIDLLHNHRWPLGKFLCGIWATTDVLLCTASILNLCVISLDRYMAITSPLKYPRTRSRKMAAGLLSCVWILSLIVCSPPWFVPGWGLFDNENEANMNGTNSEDGFVCAYSSSVPYRIYSASGSFYIPLMVMLSVYFKIFRVASEREALLRNSVGTCRLSNRIAKTKFRDYNRAASSSHIRARPQLSTSSPRANQSVRPFEYHGRYQEVRDGHRAHSTTDSPNPAATSNGTSKDSTKSSLGRESFSMADLSECSRVRQGRTSNGGHFGSETSMPPEADALVNKNTETSELVILKPHEPSGGRPARGSKEKMVYLRERKALKTIGIVVLGFIICWMPFFVMYLLEVIAGQAYFGGATFNIINQFFLWLGYSNSVLNPVIYTMYNGDFRRCFRDLLSFGCIQHHRRTMSVKKLHQQSTIF